MRTCFKTINDFRFYVSVEPVLRAGWQAIFDEIMPFPGEAAKRKNQRGVAMSGDEDEALPAGGARQSKRTKKKRMGAPLVFDEEKRIEYLTGFRKRKLQRQEQGKKKLQEKAKRERIERRRERREAIAEADHNTSTDGQQKEDRSASRGFLLSEMQQASKQQTKNLEKNSKYEDEEAVVTVTVEAMGDEEEEDEEAEAEDASHTAAGELFAGPLDEPGVTPQALDLFRRLGAGEKVSFQPRASPSTQPADKPGASTAKRRTNKPQLKGKGKKQAGRAGGKAGGRKGGKKPQGKRRRNGSVSSCTWYSAVVLSSRLSAFFVLPCVTTCSELLSFGGLLLTQTLLIRNLPLLGISGKRNFARTLRKMAVVSRDKFVHVLFNSTKIASVLRLSFSSKSLGVSGVKLPLPFLPACHKVPTTRKAAG
eukprot:g23939.t1